MSFPKYPASTFVEATNLAVFSANQLRDFVNGDINTEIETEEGGLIPSVAKALNEAATYKASIPWNNGDVQTDLMQPRDFNGTVYVPRIVPVTLGAFPTTGVGGEWRAPSYLNISNFSQVYNNVANMKADTTLTIGRKVHTLGYYTPGDGGGNDYEIVAAGTGTDDGGSFIDLTGSGLQAKGFFSDATVRIEQFGAEDETVTGQDVRVQNAIDYCDSNRMTLDLGNKKLYLTSGLAMPANLSVVSGGQSSIEALLSAPGPAIEILPGNNTRKIFGTIANFGIGLKVRSSVGFTQFRTISGCGKGLLLSGEGSSVLDSVIYGTQIGGCDEAITFESNSDSIVMQGNEIRVNFINVCRESVVFNDNGTHTATANWDSNIVHTQAIDPITTGPTGSVLINKSVFSVPRFKLVCESWLGGLDVGAKLVKGQFSDLVLDVSLAQPMDLTRIDSSSINSLGSATINIRNKDNFGAGSAAFKSTVTSSVLGDFNGGVVMSNGKNGVKVITGVELAPGQETQGPRAFHFLSKSNNYTHFKLSRISGPRAALVYVQPAGTEVDGMLRFVVVNIGTTNLPSGSEFFCELRIE